jgi:hypothetical protein
MSAVSDFGHLIGAFAANSVDDRHAFIRFFMAGVTSLSSRAMTSALTVVVRPAPGVRMSAVGANQTRRNSTDDVNDPKATSEIKNCCCAT